MSRIVAGHGSWKSSISSAMLTSASVSLGELAIGPQCVYWTEGRPLEGGRIVIVRGSIDGTCNDVTPPGFNARTRVHEYGGGSYSVHENQIFFSNFLDQRLYRQNGASLPLPITPEPSEPATIRYADGRVAPDGRTLICVRERHEPGREAINELAALSLDGSHEQRVIAGGRDFYSSPRFSPDGQHLAWLVWDHPNMPWDGTELWVGALHPTDGLTKVRCVAGGSKESIFQPEWSPEGVLHFISDRTGWWNLYAERNGQISSLASMEAEFGVPQWIFGVSRYAFFGVNHVAAIYSRNGLDHFAVIDSETGSMITVDLGYTSFLDLKSDGDRRIFFIAASSTIAAQVMTMDFPGHPQVLKSSIHVEFDTDDMASPEPVEFPTSNGRTAFALFYAPANKNYIAPAGEKPPLLVLSHGGPTSATTSSLKLALQYWTSRGFAVVDVNYGGSTGYGREYRERLNGKWGIVDVEDCINAARYLAARGDVDPQRMAIRGGSAGGYTTLCALVFHDVFRAGASHYGVADLILLARDTHKFESRYTDRLIGPYPETAEIYRQRSPIHFADRLACPVILFQGLEDRVVPPSQAETFIAALRAKGLPFAYVAFPNEGHGFRQAQNIQRAAEAELYFYSRVFEFTPADTIQPVEIEGEIRGQAG